MIFSTETSPPTKAFQGLSFWGVPPTLVKFIDHGSAVSLAVIIIITTHMLLII